MIGFKERFVRPITKRTKRQTIRKGRKSPPTKIVREKYHAWARWYGYPPAAPGETLILSAGVRTANYRELRRVTCVSVEPIWMYFYSPTIVATRPGGVRTPAIVLGLPTKAEDPLSPDSDSDNNFLDDRFARADGFDDLADFYRWFAKNHGIGVDGAEAHERKTFIGWIITW